MRLAPEKAAYYLDHPKEQCRGHKRPQVLDNLFMGQHSGVYSIKLD